MFLLTDEDFNEHIARAMRRNAVHVVESVRRYLPEGTPDAEVLELGARLSAVVLTHDIHTLVPIAYDRLRRGLNEPPVIVVRKYTPVARAAADILLIVEASVPEDWESTVFFVPF